jgi:hypothetical protein
MPKAKPVSLHPLTFDEAIKAIISVDPEKVGITSKHRGKRRRKIVLTKKTRLVSK